MTKKKRTILIVVSFLAIVLTIVSFILSFYSLSRDYNIAMDYYNNCDYTSALIEFKALGNYRDSKKLAEKVCAIVEEIERNNSMEETYNYAINLLLEGEYKNAINEFSSLGEYSDSKEKYAESKYLFAKELLVKGEYKQAYQLFNELGDYKDCSKLALESQVYLINDIQNAAYDEALTLMDDEKYGNALTLFGGLAQSDFKDAKQQTEKCKELMRLSLANTFSADALYSTAITNKRKIRITGDSAKVLTDNQEFIDDWDDEDIISISAGTAFVAALRRDGTVVAKWSKELDAFEKEEWNEWNDIISITSGEYHIIGLRADGKVESFGYKKAYMNNDYGRTDVNDWDDIIQISAGSQHTVGLKKDGNVLIVGHEAKEQQQLINKMIDVNNPIIAVEGGGNHDYKKGMTSFTAILRSDGTVRVVDGSGSIWEDTEKWYVPNVDSLDKRIVSISAGANHLVALRANGTIISTDIAQKSQLNDEDWADVVAISAGKNFTLALRRDGTLLSYGEHFQKQRPRSEFELYFWAGQDVWTDVAVYGRVWSTQ